MKHVSSVTGFTIRYRPAQAGVALLAVMWAVTILGLLVFMLSTSVQTELRMTTYYKESAQADAIASSGVVEAIWAIAYPPTEESDRSSLWSWQRGQRQGGARFRAGRALLEIVNESGKLDLNSASREQLARYFQSRGMEPAAARSLAASVAHWRGPEDPEDPERETLEEYYRKMDIRPRHGPFQAVEEVLNVRGMSRELLYGTIEVSKEGQLRHRYDFEPDLTVSSGLAQVNANYASEYVLGSVPGLNRELARGIVRERARQPFQTAGEIADRLGISLPEESLPFLSTAEVKTYSVVSTGEIAGSLVRRSLKAVVQIDPSRFPRHRVVAWYDDYVGE